MKIDKKEKAVVVIGSGPGGAQVAYQLTNKVFLLFFWKLEDVL